MTKKETIKFPGVASWELLLKRWSEVPDCGEKRLLCRVIAEAICDAYRKDGGMQLVASGAGFFGGPLKLYARVLGMDCQFVRDQVLRASIMVGEKVAV